MEKQKDIAKGPGVRVQPPFIYLAVFSTGFLFHYLMPISDSSLRTSGMMWVGVLMLVIAGIFGISGLQRFIASKNTVMLMKRATTLQTNGIYRYSRNPMYLGMLFLYLSLTIFFGNWWHIILLPVLIFVMQYYVIRREEDYLKVEFGQQYVDYMNAVRRWI